jgi:hypothetical protein
VAGIKLRKPFNPKKLLWLLSGLVGSPSAALPSVQRMLASSPKSKLSVSGRVADPVWDNTGAIAFSSGVSAVARRSAAS